MLAKAHSFSLNVYETTIDYRKCLDILVKEGFKGVVSAEFEGDQLSEFDGSKATIELLKSLQHRGA